MTIIVSNKYFEYGEFSTAIQQEYYDFLIFEYYFFFSFSFLFSLY